MTGHITVSGRKIAYKRTEGTGVTVIFCGGLRSDMEGTKALHFERHCQAQGLGYVRFDYSGHGMSGGDFMDATIGQWKEDALGVIDQVTEGPLIIIGSSMGGWIGLLAAVARRDRVRGFMGIAVAPDFTKRLCWDLYPAEIRETLERDGVYYEPSDYGDDPYPFTLKLIREGNDHLMLEAPIELDCPARLFHGQQDADVPAEFSQFTADALTSRDVVITLIKNGDHRLSQDTDIKRYCAAIDALA